mmetsp:Transcript_29597/g.94518  ORF Transcript_29597/g.94518 Transcript_29597/m.94518 type:complete len:261 (+) Transcript_29597:2478-3260(+)
MASRRWRGRNGACVPPACASSQAPVSQPPCWSRPCASSVGCGAALPLRRHEAPHPRASRRARRACAASACLRRASTPGPTRTYSGGSTLASAATTPQAAGIPPPCAALRQFCRGVPPGAAARVAPARPAASRACRQGRAARAAPRVCDRLAARNREHLPMARVLGQEQAGQPVELGRRVPRDVCQRGIPQRVLRRRAHQEVGHATTMHGRGGLLDEHELFARCDELRNRPRAQDICVKVPAAIGEHDGQPRRVGPHHAHV